MQHSQLKKLMFLNSHLSDSLVRIVQASDDDNLSGYEQVIHEVIKQAHMIHIQTIHIEYQHNGIRIFFSWDKDLFLVATLGREHRHAFAMKLREISGHEPLEMRKVLEGNILTPIEGKSIRSASHMIPTATGYLFLIQLPKTSIPITRHLSLVKMQDN